MFLNYDEFSVVAKEFISLSNELCDGWNLCESEKNGVCKLFIRKETFINITESNETKLHKAEYVVSYNESYSVPTLSFNIWNSCGILLSLNDVRKLSSFRIGEKECFSVITQQEHPILFRPFYVVHPCHTGELLSIIKHNSKNVLVTYLSFISPLVNLPMPLEYGL